MMRNLTALLGIATVATALSLQAGGGKNYSVNFNTPGDLNTYFNNYTGGAYPLVQDSSSGLSGTGGLTVDLGNDTGLAILKQGFSVAVGNTWTVSAFFNDQHDAGYGGLGISATASSAQAGFDVAPNNGIGVSVHAGGMLFDDTVGSSDSALVSKTYSGGDIPSPQWYEVVDRITYNGGISWSSVYSLYNSDSSGNVGSLVYTYSTTQNNSALSTGKDVYPYVGATGDRMSEIDNFSVTTDATALVTPEPGTMALTVLGGASLMLFRRRK